jgi:polyhydroxybutyrate depolymerase
MLKWSCVVALVLSLHFACAQLTPGQHTLEITGRPEGTRRFVVYVPKSYTTAPANSVPVVFAWHGYTEGCYFFVNYTGWSNQSEASGFIAVYPCGTGLLASFNAGTCCGGNKNDDIEFARLMVLRLQKELPKIKAASIFTCGFSNGGMMSELLACRMPNVFRAIATVAGTMAMSPGGQQGLANCDGAYDKSVDIKRHVAILKVHATGDAIVPYRGTSNWPSVDVDMKRWANRTKCTGNPVQTWKTDQYFNSIYQHCPGGPVETVTWQGGLHWWPGANGQNLTGFVTTDYAWKFFKKYA